MIGVLLITILVVSFSSAAGLASTYDSKLADSSLQNFNSNFEQNAVGPVEIQKIITMVYFAKDYNTRNDLEKGDSLYISVILDYKELTDKTDNELVEIMNNYTFVDGDDTQFQMYNCSIEYSDSGRVQKITCKKV